MNTSIDACHHHHHLISFFSPLEVIGIIKRKALIKDLAAAYHAECVAYCRELLQLQKKWEEVSALFLLLCASDIL